MIILCGSGAVAKNKNTEHSSRKDTFLRRGKNNRHVTFPRERKEIQLPVLKKSDVFGGRLAAMHP